MGLRERMERLGKRMGILQAAGTSKEAPPKISTRSVGLDELLAGIQVLDIRGSSETRVDLPIGFEGIMEAAGIHAPPHGWTVERLLEFLRTECRELTRDKAQARALEALARDKASTEDVVRDAVARDQALDAFERFAKEKLVTQQRKRQERLAACEEQLQAMQREIDRIRREQGQEEQDWRAWHKSKVDHEREMAWALSFLMEKPLITIDEEAE